MDSLNLVPNKKGSNNLEYKGYHYCKSKSYVRDNGIVTYWVCQLRCQMNPLLGKKLQICYGVLHTLEKDGHLTIKREPNEHTCPLVSGIQRGREKLRNDIRSIAISSTESPSVIIEDFKRTKTLDELKSMPKVDLLRRSIERVHRAKAKQNQPSDPMKLSADIVPDAMKTTISGEQFFRTAIIQDGCLNLIFTTENDLLALQQSQFWLMVGTFQTLPKLSYQLYTIHGSIGRSDEESTIVPLVYVLMDSNLQNAYEDVLAYIACQMENIEAQFMISDFDIAAIEAIRNVFPEISSRGCYFLLKQAFSKHMKSFGLDEIYMNNRLFAKYVNMLGNTAFLPESEIPAGFQLIKEKFLEDFPAVMNLDEFLRYIDIYYVNGRPRGVSSNGTQRFGTPHFPPSFWTVAKRTNLGFPSTSKNLKAWNNRWSCLLGKKNVGVNKCIEELRKEQHAVTSKLHKSLISDFVPSKRKNILEKESSLREFLEVRTEMELFDFLEALTLRLEEAQ